MTLTIPRLLVNHNSGNRNPHWRVKHRERQAWVHDLGWALREARLTVGPAPKQRMRLVVERYVASRRNFIRDRDNLLSATKELRDAIKAVGLIYDDSMAWLDMPDPIQRVCREGKPRTVLTIEPCE